MAEFCVGGCAKAFIEVFFSIKFPSATKIFDVRLFSVAVLAKPRPWYPRVAVRLPRRILVNQAAILRRSQND